MKKKRRWYTRYSCVYHSALDVPASSLGGLFWLDIKGGGGRSTCRGLGSDRPR